MDKGWHPLDERYVEAYGAYARTQAGDGAVSANPRCPLCLAELVFTHRRRGGYRYYRHLDSADDARCPLTTSSYEPAGLTVGASLDTNANGLAGGAAGPLHRERFLQHWQRHFRIARHAAPPLTLERFARLIEYADVVDLWRYPAFDERDVPYVLLALAGFISVNDRDERARIRLCFDGSVRDVGDLWRDERRVPAGLFRVTYREPLHTPFPTAADILFWEPVERIERLADCPAPRLRQTQIRAFNRFIGGYERERDRRGERDAGESE
ncbi:hypothetical protein LMG24238_00491 [Paraburkholderia sediminicola]|uniref:Uncharacterized protein n=1 Tax=Paraburkholderia sediminicola TaxID=458836 RepID=A0A6J4ZUC5_9BURK|nr:hypothetical protein [Paraburkholderia sediminicola]CAB3643388.1 hypothetical protein LMG24238_00491 [Paraburkholderia sediminicola]